MGLLLNSDRYFPRGLGLNQEAKKALAEDYHSNIVARIRENGFEYREGKTQLYLAKEFGFCYGVDRAVEYAYESCRKFPDRRIFLANEIIHNPHVNERLGQMGVRLLPLQVSLAEKLAPIRAEDVVLISAFGAPVEEMRALHDRGCILVDTTCGSVMSVWKNVERYAREGFTAIVHGKYEHEETKATCSRVTQYPGAQYLVVRDLEQARLVCQFIEQDGESEKFLNQFVNAHSVGFDPNQHLGALGLANQTTMLSGESLEIARMLKVSLEKRYGSEEIAKRFCNFDTICSATQERQDAVRELLEKPLDLMLVIGGYNSSNTTHLAEIAVQRVKSYHISDADCLVSKDSIRHKPVTSKNEIVESNWLPSGEIQVGVTSGASTPNSKVGEVIERLLRLRAGETS